MRNFDDIRPELEELLTTFNKVLEGHRAIKSEAKALNKRILKMGCLGSAIAFFLLPLMFIGAIVYMMNHQGAFSSLMENKFFAGLIEFIPRLIFPSIIGIVAFIIIKYALPQAQKKKLQRADFKEMVIRPFTQIVFGPETYYQAHALVSPAMKAQWQRSAHPGFAGIDGIQDVIKTKIGPVDVIISEFDKGQGPTPRGISQASLILVADFHKTFSGSVGLRFGSPERSTLDMLIKDAPDELEDPRFNALYTVIGEDRYLTRFILSLKMMHSILALLESHGRPMEFLFLDSKMYLRLYWNKDMLEYESIDDITHKKGTKKILGQEIKYSYTYSGIEFESTDTLASVEHFKTFYDDLAIIAGLLEDLDQNTRIWGDKAVAD